MAPVKHEQLSGWGLTPSAVCTSYRPEKERELAQIVAQHPSPLIARGLGRSYGDAALSNDGLIRMERLDHFIEFDESAGTIRAQAGVTLSELMDFSIPRGFLPPVIPGTKYVTLGGCFASNVHGKNVFRDGEFAEHVLSIRLLLADGRRIECGPREHSDIFWASAGGMGMTGVIEELTLKLRPIESASLRAEIRQVGSIEGMISEFEAHRESSDYMVGWIDHMARDRELGRGIFEAASHMDRGGQAIGSYKPSRIRYSIPCFAPSFLLNKYSMALYNRKRFKKMVAGSHMRTFAEFFHPLDTLGHWNKLYGKRGFFQYQCIFPEGEQSAALLRQFLASLQQAGIFSFLAVIKYHRAGKGLLSFSQNGYSIALDFPNTARVRSTIPQLNRWVADVGGRVYLAKDALLDAESFAQMYGEKLAPWRELIHEMDPTARFSSLMSERLQWKRRV